MYENVEAWRIRRKTASIKAPQKLIEVTSGSVLLYDCNISHACFSFILRELLAWNGTQF